MFSKELESLIQATLEDGILEDNEKAALVKRAQNEGVDLDELEIYINSILQKRKRELNEKKESEYSQIEKEKKAALGKVCPKCGRQVAPLTLVCECGFEFIEHKKTESAVEKLANKIDEINSSETRWREEDEDARKRKDQEILDVIMMFPVPNTKEDIIDFLALATPNSKLRGGLFGTILGRLSVLVPIVIIICIALYFVLPDTEVQETTKGLAGVFTGEKEAHESAVAAPVTGILLFFGLVGSFIFAFNFDKETLRHNKFAKVWRAKFDQVMMKGRSLRADAEFSRMLDYYEKQVNR